MEGERAAGNSWVLADILESLRILTPVERMVLCREFELGEISDFTQAWPARRLAKMDVAGLQTLALRKLRGSSLLPVELRDTRWRGEPGINRKPVVVPLRPNIGGPIDFVPPTDRFEPDPDEDFDPEWWDEA